MPYAPAIEEEEYRVPMGEIASSGQLRLSLARWVMVTVPAIMLLGYFSAMLGQSGEKNRWYAALLKPEINPPGWVFMVVWPILYIMMGVALAIILNARGAPRRGRALIVFGAQLLLNLAWSPLFFAFHQATLAAWMILIILVLAIATSFAFARVRTIAAWLLVPYMAWLSFAAILAFQIDAKNPDAETLVPEARRTHISL